jgi:hypothetical protein
VIERNRKERWIRIDLREIKVMVGSRRTQLDGGTVENLQIELDTYTAIPSLDPMGWINRGSSILRGDVRRPWGFIESFASGCHIGTVFQTSEIGRWPADAKSRCQETWAKR